MLEDFLANMTFSPAMIGAIVAGFVLFSLGRASKGGGARKREEEMKRDLLEAKASVPQLESTVRNRDQQITRLQEEVNDLNDRSTDLIRGQDEKGTALRRAEREVKNLTSELNAVRGVRQDDNNIIMDGFDDEPAGDPGDSGPVKQLKKLEALYEKLKGALIQRDARIEELETLLEGIDETTTQSSTASPLDDDAVAAETKPLEDKISAQNSTIETLQEQLSELRKEKEMLEDLANRRSRSNRALKDASAEAEARVPVLEKEITERDTTIETREASIKRLLNDVEQGKAEIGSRDEKIETLKSDVFERIEALETSERKQTELEASLTQREERIAALDSELAGVLKNMEHLQSDLRGARQKLDEQQASVDQVEEELKRRDQAAESLQSTIRDRDFRLDAVTNEKTALQAELDEAQRETQDARNSVQAVRDEAEDARVISDKRYQATESEKTVSEQQISGLKREIEDLKSNLTQHEQWMEKLKASMEERENRATEQSARIESLQAELKQAEDQARNRHDERQMVEDAKHELDRELVTLKTRVEQTQAELAEQAQSVAVYKSMLADKDFQIESLEQEVRTLTGNPPGDSNPEESASHQAVN